MRSRTHHARIPACVEIRRQRPPRRVAVAFEVGEGEVSAATERRRKPGLRDAGQQGTISSINCSDYRGSSGYYRQSIIRYLNRYTGSSCKFLNIVRTVYIILEK